MSDSNPALPDPIPVAVQQLAWWRRTADYAFTVVKQQSRQILLSSLRHSSARFLGGFFGFGVFALAAYPDFSPGGTEVGFVLYGLLLLLYTLSVLFREGVHFADLQEQRATFEAVGDILSAQSRVTPNGSLTTEVGHRPELVVPELLRRAVELANQILKPPPGTSIRAHLLMPVPNEEGNDIGGLRTVYSDRLFGMSTQVIPLDAPGAPVTLLQGRVQAFPSTRYLSHSRVQGRAYRSFATFPIRVGGRNADEGKYVGVLAMGANQEYVFTESSVRDFQSLLSPISQLIGLVLAINHMEIDDGTRHP